MRIIRKRPDGYHDIETVFYPIHLSDEIEISEGERVEFYSNVALHNDKKDGTESNLCLRALRSFCERTGINAEVKIRLQKNIPLGSGLGGGSSDAAAMLKGLQEIYGDPLSPIEMLDIARLLGSDVAFFLNGSPSYATGRGDVIEPLRYSIRQHILTLTPDISVSTAFAYSVVTPTGLPAKSLREALRELDDSYSRYNGVIINDFEGVIVDSFPVIGRIKSELENLGASYVSMSGSGSSIYGFFSTEDEAANARDIIGAKYKLRAGDITPPAA